MYSINVVGSTTEHSIYLASKERPFKINEILIINNKTRCEIISTRSLNRLIPMVNEQNRIMDESVIESLMETGFSIDEEEVFIAKANILDSLSEPVSISSSIRVPAFEEVKDLMIKSEQNLTLGVIKETKEIYIKEQFPEQYKNLMYTMKEGKLKKQEDVPLLFPYKSFSSYPHIGFFGGSGSGKSTAIRVFCEELMKRNIPNIVWDRHKEFDFKNNPDIPENYGDFYASKYKTFTIGKDVGINFIDLTINELSNLLKASGGNFTESMSTALGSIFFSKKDTLSEFEQRLNILISISDNINDNNDNNEGKEMIRRYGNINVGTLKGISWRLNRLKYMGLFKFSSKQVIESIKKLQTVVIQGNLKETQMYMAYILKKVFNLRKSYIENTNGSEFSNSTIEYFPPFFTTIDEAHNFASKAEEMPTTSVIKEYAQEGRKFGVFIAPGTQRAGLLNETILAQLSTKYIFRTVRGQDIKLLKDETDLTTEASNRLPYLESGECFMSSAVFQRTLNLKIRFPETSKLNEINPFDELIELNNKEDKLFFNCIKEELPFKEHELFRILQNLENKHNLVYTLKQLKAKLESNTNINVKNNIMGNKYEKA